MTAKQGTYKAVRAILFAMAFAAIVFVTSFVGTTQAFSDPVTFQNVDVDATASGEVNGPWTLTFTAQQDRAPEGNEVDYGANAEIKISLAGVLASPNATVSLNPSDSGATYTLENDQLTVTGYDYSAHLGSPLTITVSNVVVDDWNLSQNSNIAAGVETSVEAISGIKWFSANDGMHSVDFPAPLVKVVKLAAPKPTWNGKTVS